MDKLWYFSYFCRTNGRKTHVLRWASAHLKIILHYTLITWSLISGYLSSIMTQHMPSLVPTKAVFTAKKTMKARPAGPVKTMALARASTPPPAISPARKIAAMASPRPWAFTIPASLSMMTVSELSYLSHY